MAFSIDLTGKWLSARTRNLLTMVFFGLLSLLAGSIRFQIPGVPGGVSDLREVAVLTSVLYLTHWAYGLGVALITSTATPAEGSVLSTFAMHAVGVVAAWHFFNRARAWYRGEVSFGLATFVFVLLYYVVLLLPIMAVTNAMAGLIEGAAIAATYREILRVLPFEIVTTAGIVTLWAVAYKMYVERQAVLEEAYDATLEGWARALELRDRETEGHTRRVSDLTVRLGRAFGLAERELKYLWRGAILHDIGKMGVPDRVLLKPGEPTESEMQLLREHPEHARRLLETIDFLRPALDIPCSHHERWDGSGYPLGLTAEHIPFAARLFAVIDVWDALLSDRPYRNAWDRERVVQHLREGSGTLFDPQVVEVFLRDVIDCKDKGG